MCCVCESADSFVFDVADYQFCNTLATIEDGPRSSFLVVYDTATDDEVKFKIRFCPMCGRKLAGRGER